MFDCKDTEKIANLYIDNELNNSDKIKFEKHINSCTACQEEYQQLLAIKNLVSETQEELPDDFSSILHQKLLKETTTQKTKSANFWANYSNYVKLSTGIAATVLLAFVANWGLTGYWQLSRDPATMPQMDDLYNLEQEESDGNGTADFGISSIPSDKYDDSLSDDASRSLKQDIDEATDTKEPLEESPQTSGDFQIESFIHDTPDEDASEALEDLEDSEDLEALDSSSKKRIETEIELPKTEQDEEQNIEEETTEPTDDFTIQGNEIVPNDTEQTNEHYKEFKISQYGVSAYIEIYELTPVDLNDNEFETSIFISTSQPDQVKNLIIGLADFQGLEYDEDSAEDNLLTFDLNSSDYNSIITLLSLMEEVPTVDLARAKPESNIKTSILIEKVADN